MKQREPADTADKLAHRAHIQVRGFPPDLPATAWLSLDEVLQYVPISRTGWFRGMASGQLPRPHKIGRLSFWKARDIRKLLDLGPAHVRRRKPARPRQDAPDANEGNGTH